MNEAKIKLTVDATQAHREMKLVDQELRGMGRGSSPKPESGIGESSRGTTASDQAAGISSAEVEKLVHAQERFLNSFSEYLTNSSKDQKNLSSKMDTIIESLSKGNSSSNSGRSGGSGGGRPTSSSNPLSSSSGGDDFSLKGLLGQLTATATIASAVKGIITYVGSGGKESYSSERLAYDVYNKSGLYTDFSKARDYSASLGADYGYNVNETLSVQSGLVKGTGVMTQDEIDADTASALRTGKALSMDADALVGAYSGFYNTGTYQQGDMSRFVEMFAEATAEGGMKGREDEQLDILESINDLLGKNLTEVTANQYENAVGFYTALSSQSAAMSGSTAANTMEKFNNSITNGGNAMDILLGKGTQYTDLWEFRKQKEKGLTDPTNVQNIVKNLKDFYGVDIGSTNESTVKETLYRLLGGDYSTTEIDSLLEVMKSEDYALDSGYTAGKEYLSETGERYDNSKVSTKDQYEAETENAKQRTGNLWNKATSWTNDLYNSLPEPLQQVLGVAGAGVKAAAPSIGTWGLFKGIGKAKGAFASSQASKFENFASYADDIVDTANLGGDVEDVLKGLSKDGKVTDDMLNWADDLVDAYNLGGNVDDVLEQGYKQFGKGFSKASKASKAANSVDDVVGTADDVVDGIFHSADDVAGSAGKGLKGLSKVGKGLAIAGTVVEVGTTAYDAYGEYKEGNYKGVAEEVGGGAGSLAGGWAGAKGGAAAGAAIGSFFPGAGTAIGGAIGGVIGAIGGAIGGDWLGEKLGGGTFSLFSSDKDGEENTDALEENTKAIESLSKEMSTDSDPELTEKNKRSSSTSTTNSSSSWLSRLFGKSHAIGNDYVPYDGYLAELHKGETVLDAHTATEYRQGKAGQSFGGTTTLEIKLSGGISGMTTENQGMIVAEVIRQLKAQSAIENSMNQLSYNNIRFAN